MFSLPAAGIEQVSITVLISVLSVGEDVPVQRSQSSIVWLGDGGRKKQENALECHFSVNEIFIYLLFSKNTRRLREVVVHCVGGRDREGN